ncbi:helix-turn-helix domain-containing protein [Flavobacterium gilvum]|uniref:Transcriptional regulator n=1 Tax=Flavobacterium gilvum TaxID=1492737 RepID=A0AAC9I4C6_9FLAO|nr:AraC family transcriptional regulator [Flavobacterium gilvum]AOW09337.1 transcriptional regulator [Flavobacterium gilvum]KFC58940.1 transcriptional regulator [Flavobacterium gilvum]
MSISITTHLPETAITNFVDSFWALHNTSDFGKNIIILPDGRIDLLFSKSTNEPYHIMLLGISTQPEQVVIAPNSVTFAISLKLPAIEYILKSSIADILDNAKNVTQIFSHIDETALDDFDTFCKNATKRIKELIPENLDKRKIKLFDLIYASKGNIAITELSKKVFWSSRQINRYFNQQLGIPLKTYCNIVRFRASFEQLKNGKLFPEGNYTDQSHFIKEIKKLSGVLPKDLYKNINDRFIQLTDLKS